MSIVSITTASIRIAAIRIAAIRTASIRTASIRTGSVKPGSFTTGAISHGVLVAVLAPLLIAACNSTNRSAPVHDRTPAPTVSAAKESRTDSARKPAPTRAAAATSGAAVTDSTRSSTAQKPAASAQSSPARSVSRNRGAVADTDDWRPDYYTVRKGDTLYSIALDFGHDYRDLAAWNNLANASYIQIGQRLRLSPPAGQNAAPTATLPAATLPGTDNKQSTSVSAPLFTDPKAYRSAFSEQALSDMRRILAGEVETAVVAVGPAQPKPAPAAAPSPAAPTPAKPAATAAVRAADEALKWEWPATGELLYPFSKGPIKKGVGIEGNPGQSVVSSAPGKVVYSGSGLRGYGNLIIVKHNDTYLSVYAHNQQLLVSEGQMVAQGQKIAVMGEISAGRTGLHFEIRRLGKPMDPLAYLPDRRS